MRAPEVERVLITVGGKTLGSLFLLISFLQKMAEITPSAHVRNCADTAN